MALITTNKKDMARFHAGGNFQPAYYPVAGDELQRELAAGYCQTAPKPPFVNGSEGPMFGRNVFPAPGLRSEPPIGFQKPFTTEPGQMSNEVRPKPMDSSALYPGDLCYGGNRAM